MIAGVGNIYRAEILFKVGRIFASAGTPSTAVLLSCCKLVTCHACCPAVSDHTFLNLFEVVYDLAPVHMRHLEDVVTGCNKWCSRGACKSTAAICKEDRVMQEQRALAVQAGVHPEQPGHTLSRAEFDAVWEHSVLLLQRGFQEGSILTVDPAEARKLGPPWTRRHAAAMRRLSRPQERQNARQCE